MAETPDTSHQHDDLPPRTRVSEVILATDRAVRTWRDMSPDQVVRILLAFMTLAAVLGLAAMVYMDRTDRKQDRSDRQDQMALLIRTFESESEHKRIIDETKEEKRRVIDEARSRENRQFVIDQIKRKEEDCERTRDKDRQVLLAFTEKMNALEKALNALLKKMEQLCMSIFSNIFSGLQSHSQ